MRAFALVAACFVAQLLLGHPIVPSWMGDVRVVLVVLAARVLMMHERRDFAWGILVGLLWDAAFEEVVGPGAIAWSAASLGCGFLGDHLLDRRPRAWGAVGVVGELLVVVVHHCALLPLGLVGHFSLVDAARAAALTGLWCVLVGWVLSLNLPARWRSRRARRLR